MEEAMKKRGRCAHVEKSKIIDAILKYKNKIVLHDGSLVSKLSTVWLSVASDLDNMINPLTLHSYVCNNKYNIRCLLTGPSSNDSGNKEIPAQIDLQFSTDKLDENEESSDLQNSSEDACIKEELHFIVSLDRREFNALIADKIYKRKTTNGSVVHQQIKAFIPGEWENVVSEKIWSTTHVKCAYNFKNHYLNSDATYGTFIGSCKCGGQLNGKIYADENCANFNCTLTFGDKKCGKRYLRCPNRGKVVKKLCSISTKKYQSGLAKEPMLQNDPVSPHLYNSSVLCVAKHEYMPSQYLHEEPIHALLKRKSLDGNNKVHSIGYDPFYVHYWTTHQLQIYKLISKKTNVCVSFDTTRGVALPVTRMGIQSNEHLFLYLGVMKLDIGQTSVLQMLSECHNSNCIQLWLEEWICTGAPPPKEAVSNFSRAFLTAMIRAFTGFLTIESYANACMTNDLPQCYVRVDVANFLKIYSNFLETRTKRIKSFYLRAIGKLIIATDLDAAKAIVRHLLIIAQNETEGNSTWGKETECERSKQSLKLLITGKSAISDVVAEIENSSSTFEMPADDVSETSEETNCLTTWGAQINFDVLHNCIAEGDRENAHFYPEFATRLLKDIQTLPLWSCIKQREFGYGRVPASSANVESEFSILKNHVFQRMESLRVDEVVDNHLDYILGETKIVHTNISQYDNMEDSYISVDKKEEKIESQEKHGNNSDEFTSTEVNVVHDYTNDFDSANIKNEEFSVLGEDDIPC